MAEEAGGELEHVRQSRVSTSCEAQEQTMLVGSPKARSLVSKWGLKSPREERREMHCLDRQ